MKVKEFGFMLNGLCQNGGCIKAIHLPWAICCRVCFSSGLSLSIVFNTGMSWLRSSPTFNVKNWNTEQHKLFNTRYHGSHQHLKIQVINPQTTQGYGH